ncbi:hypothetical protein TRP8649_04614 [Pelagimonas phthalicica]|uniref:Uncharacterized protein n=1 Tax=Pelagimonas phthalicica TaxID=1037362 RepID=A0A238JIH4_9RHOB|nr:hypothetical protein [Pelagimonas phthalicica]TDS88384.1 hypothetical protein CLV87_4618 [Pelagimonas phthalicica]SMX30470.1 hypothetical protein TRP8649_04614 [Pelagimonas phthalicica]
MNMYAVPEVAAGPNQQYWDLGLKCFTQNDNAQTALKTIWRRLPPPGDLNLLAAIVGNLYGDTFWSDQKLQMDADLLATYMNAATGINHSDCLKAANSAYRLWYGLLVRCNTSNDGLIPKTGSYTASPDVLLNGVTTLDPYDMITKWDQTTWGPAPGLKNNTYGRGQNKNLQVPIKQGEIKIYYTSNGFNQPPSSWTQLFTYDGTKQTADLVNINNQKVIRPGERSACDTSFGFEPTGAGHYCLIVCAQTEYFTNDPASISGVQWNNSSSTHWITYNGAAGWHNVNVSMTGEEPLVFYNNDDIPAKFRFVARTRNVPAGSEIAMRVADLDFAHVAKVTADDQEFVGEVEVPANYEGTLDVNFPVLPDNASISYSLVWVVDSGNPAKAGLTRLLQDGYATEDGDETLVVLGDTHFVGAQS